MELRKLAKETAKSFFFKYDKTQRLDDVRYPDFFEKIDQLVDLIINATKEEMIEEGWKKEEGYYEL